ncbi:MAG: 16S rRNA (adenine(1518)-N(6)/adenine(1519)-N(6))-dimethyltransferase RsmA [Hyphomicrobiaceae bacterium]|nr:16S rRNA (adenine(1518)-N(6)/adenine(1519)-N(6))-dimethyltransferase RsmA [Hyphomicrobiaceae bacterium]MCC0024687.1 16S rRNA (adenine(1518)-N(6)/adenine(1519)-N(6))-dimethyltransferase RsmA [Hyphomicrobiaceae bacterium]
MSGIDDLPPLREVIAQHGLSARKELGQNFLFDLNLTGRIARAAGNLSRATIIEIGPGPGGLTRAMLAAGAKKLIVIERDQRVCPILEEISAAYPGRMQIIEADALEIDPVSLTDGPIKVVANLPYNVATPLLTGWLTHKDWSTRFESLTLMFQREVADRITTGPGSKTYGRLSVLCAWKAERRKLFDVSRSAFTPPPKVTSSIVQLVPRQNVRDVPLGLFEEVTRSAFGQRRKMVRQSLKGLDVSMEALLDAANLKGTERAEELALDQFLDLAEAVGRARSKQLSD